MLRKAAGVSGSSFAFPIALEYRTTASLWYRRFMWAYAAFLARRTLSLPCFFQASASSKGVNSSIAACIAMKSGWFS